MDLGFGPEHRLLTPAQFKNVFDGATCKASGPNLLLLARHNSQAQARLGLVIAKKNVRHAVDRNKVKRIARESFRHHRAELDHLDIVVLARKGLGELDNAALHVLFQDMWRRLNKAADKYNRTRNSGPPSSNA
ncbi:ribonuclease P protein component [Pseudomonas sp. G11-1]|uniref:Ribonuclease P protein component n=1 Tax=Halopseudomonas bauzanensis TaxID=653930 RepID=A0A1I4LRW3_9GAMM|nr:ribonuclease P protein component [Halopseudomonas bauzanensis]MCO5786949.1 ribonuclease P protein component [Pseudomonas sp. G11-1]MCO5790175.1 ribonuclease P protein component [Pseudomonas sp. G11-2]SER87224.1 ribonuclease P protein component [Halopseudomonas bauzanensis]SFL93641.1 ribonuclease P protein component [Halopseudomonas bauzanensis]